MTPVGRAEKADAEDRQHSEMMVQLLTNAQQPLKRYIRTLVPHRADADDVLQQVNLLLWQRIEEYQPDTNSTAWACRVAYYQVLTLHKQTARSRLRLSDALVEQLAANVTTDCGWINADVDAFELCMAKLSLQDKELIQLRYEPDATVESVARHVGRSTKAVYNAICRVCLTATSGATSYHAECLKTMFGTTVVQLVGVERRPPFEELLDAHHS